MSIEQLTKQFRPFNVPPVPVPFDEANAGVQSKRAAAQQRLKEQRENGVMQGRAVRRKTYKTTLTISEATSADGQLTYTFSASPVVEHERGDARQRSGVRVVSTGTTARRLSPSTLTVLPLRTASGVTVTKYNNASAAEGKVAGKGEEVKTDMAEADRRDKRKMMLISVKRRRQLKMKKHKYKKLMKRTRNLRRREGRN